MKPSTLRSLAALVSVASLLAVSGCATSAPKPPKHLFETTYQDPDARPMKLRGAKVVAAVMIQAPDARRRAEDALAKAITDAGGQGIALYSLSKENAATQA